MTGVQRGRARPTVDWLSECDWDVLTTLATVRVASTDQLRRLHFTGVTERSCQRTLVRLGRERLVARLARRVGGVTPGSAPWAYALGSFGQRLFGLAGPKGGRVRRPLVPSPMFLRHALMVTEVYVCAVEVTRDRPLRLERFWVDADCWRALPDRSELKPDAELILVGTGYEDHYLVEADCATEGPAKLRRKFAQYRALLQAGTEQAEHGVFPRVLFVVPTERRRLQIASLLVKEAKTGPSIFAVTTLAQLPRFLALGDGDTQESGR